jgi:hypothetical protein
MKAAVYTRYGPPDVVQIKGLEKPVPKDLSEVAEAIRYLEQRHARGKVVITLL